MISFPLLSITVLLLIREAKLKGKVKKFVQISAYGALGFIGLSILHNLFYAGAEVFQHITVVRWIFEILHITAFLVSLLVCPIAFLYGAIRSIILFTRRS